MRIPHVSEAENNLLNCRRKASLSPRGQTNMESNHLEPEKNTRLTPPDSYHRSEQPLMRKHNSSASPSNEREHFRSTTPSSNVTNRSTSGDKTVHFSDEPFRHKGGVSPVESGEGSGPGGSNSGGYDPLQRARKRKLSHPVQYSAAVAAATSKSDDSLSETGGESNSVTTNDTNDHNNEGQEDPTKH